MFVAADAAVLPVVLLLLFLAGLLLCLSLSAKARALRF